MVKNPSTYQAKFFDMVRERVPDNEMLVDILAEVLDCSKDSAYRRIRGTTDLNVNDMVKVAKHFNIPLNEWAGQSGQSVVFQNASNIRSLEDFRSYLLTLSGQLQRVLQYPDHKVIYQAKDIPIYYHFRSPKLTSFKIYLWLKTMYNIPEFQGVPYRKELIPTDLVDLAKELWESYCYMNSVEIWNDTSVVSLISQLEYYYEAGLMESKEDTLILCEEAAEMLRLIKAQSVKAKKAHPYQRNTFTEATYDLYYHEILLMDNHIMAQLNENRRIYFIPYAGLNYLNTQDPKLNKQMAEYLEGQIKKSSLIRDMSEKERNKFFIRIIQRIELLKSKIEATSSFM